MYRAGIGEYNDSSAGMGPIDFIFVSTYLLNFEFLLDEVPELLSLPRACVVYGAKEGTEDAWRQACTTLEGQCSVDFLCRDPSAPKKSANNQGAKQGDDQSASAGTFWRLSAHRPLQPDPRREWSRQMCWSCE